MNALFDALIQLLPVAAVVYLWDAVAWLRQGDLLFRWGWPSRPTVRTAGLRLAPLLPSGRAAIALGHRPAVCPDGVVVPASGDRTPGGWSSPDAWRLVPWSDIGAVEIEHRTLSLGDTGLRMASHADARALAAAIARVRQVPPDDRSEQAQTVLELSFDAALVARRLAAFERAVTWLDAVGTVLFVLLFVVVPIAGWSRDVVTWRTGPLLVSLLAATIATAVLGIRAARRLAFERVMPAPWSRLVALLLMPPMAPRAACALSLELFAGLEASAVASALLPEAAGRRWLRQAAVEARLALAGDGPDWWRWWWRRREQNIELLALRIGTSIAELTAPVALVDTDAIAACPYCGCCFADPVATCPDCQVPTVSNPQGDSLHGG